MFHVSLVESLLLIYNILSLWLLWWHGAEEDDSIDLTFHSQVCCSRPLRYE